MGEEQVRIQEKKQQLKTPEHMLSGAHPRPSIQEQSSAALDLPSHPQSPTALGLPSLSTTHCLCIMTRGSAALLVRQQQLHTHTHTLTTGAAFCSRGAAVSVVTL